ncbi:MAG TPA: SMP-30/gluconolactonase/LRE family protein [Nevskiales bacterium]|nr:SMP-30/gluconolactonase/LRE family protein [Nevskiales bacterium]
MKKVTLVLVLLLALLLAYLFFWPVPIEPVAWQAPPAPKLEGPYAVNDYLAGVERIGEGAGIGPEDVDVDSEGRIYGAYADGKIRRFDAQGKPLDDFADTGGRPLGLDFAANGMLLVADAKKGLLAIRPDGGLRVLSTEANGVPYKFTDDVDVGPDGMIYFSDASDKFGYGEHMADILEHGGRGRLLRYDPLADQTTVLLDGLNFANGVAVSRGGDFVLVNETGSYRILRYWLKGPKAGQHDVFFDNLPGIPDGVSCSDAGVFWVALYSPRSKDLDRMSDKPWMRKLAMRLPEALQPKPARHAFVLGLDENGKVIHNLQDAGKNAYAPITSVEQEGDWLYLGSLTQPSIGRIKAPSP